MPTGTFGGFPFDPEVYGSFVDQEPVFTDSIIASGILASDTNMTTLLDNGGTVGTTRFYNPLDPDTDAPLVRNGTTNNTPVEISGGKQSFIRMDRMKAWKANQLVRELTAANPIQAVARHTAQYWRVYLQGLLVKTADAVLQLGGLASHVMTATGGVTSGLLIDGQQAALGEFARKFGLFVMHSKIFAEYQKMGLVDYNKYTITNVLQREVELPTINGLIVIVNDRGTSHVIEEGASEPKKKVTIYDSSFIRVTDPYVPFRTGAQRTAPSQTALSVPAKLCMQRHTFGPSGPTRNGTSTVPLCAGLTGRSAAGLTTGTKSSGVPHRSREDTQNERT